MKLTLWQYGISLTLWRFTFWIGHEWRQPIFRFTAFAVSATVDMMKLFGRDIVIGIMVCNIGMSVQFAIVSDDIHTAEQFMSVWQWGPLLVEREIIDWVG